MVVLPQRDRRHEPGAQGCPRSASPALDTPVEHTRSPLDDRAPAHNQDLDTYPATADLPHRSPVHDAQRRAEHPTLHPDPHRRDQHPATQPNHLHPAIPGTERPR